MAFLPCTPCCGVDCDAIKNANTIELTIDAVDYLLQQKQKWKFARYQFAANAPIGFSYCWPGGQFVGTFSLTQTTTDTGAYRTWRYQYTNTGQMCGTNFIKASYLNATTSPANPARLRITCEFNHMTYCEYASETYREISDFDCTSQSVGFVIGPNGTTQLSPTLTKNYFGSAWPGNASPFHTFSCSDGKFSFSDVTREVSISSCSQFCSEPGCDIEFVSTTTTTGSKNLTVKGITYT
jgi:hypothetical protein